MVAEEALEPPTRGMIPLDSADLYKYSRPVLHLYCNCAADYRRNSAIAADANLASPSSSPIRCPYVSRVI